MVRMLSRRALLAASLSLAIGCTSSAVERESTSPPPDPQGKSDAQLIDHITPRRDFTGPAPTRFEWTAAKGADEYVIAVWNESDTMVWRQGRLQQTSVALPGDVVLGPGTYFWSVMGFSAGRAIAQSGLSAFVVMPQSGKE
jgi:hypothetical protein